MSEFAIRAFRETDYPFVRSSFLEWLHETEHFRRMAYGPFKAFLGPILDSLLDSWEVLVCHPEGDEDEIAGWVLFSQEEQAIGFVYTKKDPWRKMGVARRLLEATGIPIDRQVRALFWSKRARLLARIKGIRIEPISYVDGLRIFSGA